MLSRPVVEARFDGAETVPGGDRVVFRLIVGRTILESKEGDWIQESV